MWPSFLSLLLSAGSKTSQGIIQRYGTSISSLAGIFGLIIGRIFFEKITVTIFLIGRISFLFHYAFNDFILFKYIFNLKKE